MNCLLKVIVALLFLVGIVGHRIVLADEDAFARWVDRLSYKAPLVDPGGVCAGEIGALPEFEVVPETPGTHLVRVSLPFAPGALPEGLRIKLACGDSELVPDLRPLTYHPGQPVSVRRAIVTFPFEFKTTQPQRFRLSPKDEPACEPATFEQKDNAWLIPFGDTALSVSTVSVSVQAPDAAPWRADLIAPDAAAGHAGVPEVVESGEHFLWVRLLVPDTDWPHIIEVQADSLGTVMVQAHIQRLGEGDATAPDLGWDIRGLTPAAPVDHRFADGEPCTVLTEDEAYTVTFPAAPLTRRGDVLVTDPESGASIRYRRCTADEGVPFQEAAWRKAAFVVGKAGHTPRNHLLESRLGVRVAPEAFDAAYGVGTPADLALWPMLDELRAYTREAIKCSAAIADDLGNVVGFSHGRKHSSSGGLNRVNHCPSIFEDAWRGGDWELRDTAVLWCDNNYNLSVWWGDKEDFGGTRYPRSSLPEHQGDRNFMWRRNNAVGFCTKGYDSFLYAYEETGDPRMAAALRAQVDYARKFIHCDQGQCRNIGDVVDFMRLYRCTGVEMYRDEAMRLFRELRTKIGPDALFDQHGAPIIKDVPFIADDKTGTENPFAKPYIIGYALMGLPDLLRACPDEPRLRDVVRAVADFLAESQGPAGGWGYPHPLSPGVPHMQQGMENALQMARAATVLEERGEPIDNLLDAVERTLQSRVLGFERVGTIFSGIGAWEYAAGIVKELEDFYKLYEKPADRDRSRDYTEGRPGFGGSSPEGLVYFTEVLDFYLDHRPAERLFLANKKLAAVLARAEDKRIKITPEEQGSFLRMERPDNPEIGFRLWAPEWVSFPLIDYPELGRLDIDWQRDDASGAVCYTLEREDATFTACFVPYVDYVACTYTTWPKPGADVPGSFAVGPCQQMKNGIFEGEELELLDRLWFIADGQWTTIGSCANGNIRNVQYLKGRPSTDVGGAMADHGWRTIHEPRPDVPIIACTSPDGKWVAAAAAEFSESLCNNAGAGHRCIHSQGSMPLNSDGPTTLRVHAYLIEGTLEDLRARYERDRTRWKATVPAAPVGVEQTATYGVRAKLPAFRDGRVRRMTFPLAFANAGLPFDAWREKARAAYLECLSTPPPKAPFAPRVVAKEDRGTYEARKLALNISADERVLAYLLVPKGDGPFPAIVALHDHGAHFSIGKEKLIRPFGVPDAVLADAEQWADTCYGGRFIGDELARRGYVVFALDALFWNDRGRMEGIEYAEQQALAANMFQLGLSWAGTIVWNDLRSAEFLQGQPEVDPERIGCIGLSVGANRAWHLAAATDVIKAGIAVCWMGDTPSLTAEGNNQTKGQSAFSMLHPGIRNALDYADVASIACPKPMLFFNGRQDGLFPVDGVERAYARMRDVWASQGVQERLVCKLWDVPHVFNVEMQQEAFAWLDTRLKR